MCSYACLCVAVTSIRMSVISLVPRLFLSRKGTRLEFALFYCILFSSI